MSWQDYALISVVGSVLWFVVFNGRVRAGVKWPCGCGRTRLWYFLSGHAHPRLLLLDALALTAYNVWGVLSGVGDDFDGWLVMGVIVAVSSTTWVWRRWWFHEKGKIKRRAAKAAGSVVVTEHGRLAVERVRA